ncbi:MAG: SagB/ThcOx family dehydrogenase [candidate division NC10 bacterium]|nr:SagB/ThcOx family dehydrogenase [candidate division NC10 bacterium]
MTDNRQIEEAWAYHDGTKHSHQSVRASTHSLDFSNQPLPFKIYTTLPPIPLPTDPAPITMPALAAIAAPAAIPMEERIPDLHALAQVLHLSAGITRERRGEGWEVQFRAAACTGALYHIEIYLVCGDLPDLPAGVYHFGVHDFALRRLRAGDFRALLARATAGEPAVAQAPAVIVCTSTYWRNAWKYQARAYRHCFWDTGTILANLLAAAAGRALPARVVPGFVDAVVNNLLDLDSDHEASLALVPLGWTATAPPEAVPAVGPLRLETAPLSRFEVDYPAIRAMHAASSLASEDAVAAWRGGGPSGDPPVAGSRTIGLQPLGDADAPADSVTEVILRRGSSRRFTRKPLTFPQLSTMLDRATRGVPADFLDPPGATLLTLYVIVHAVEGLAPGAYVYHRRDRGLELLREGNFRNQAGYLGLEQELPAEASVNVYCLADLRPILARFGNRGYRAAQLEGGITGGKLYLAAYAERLGATGLTFYDDAVTEFFSPHAAPKESGTHGGAVGTRRTGKSVMFLTALGVPARRRAGS